MIPIKNERQIGQMREACAVAATVLHSLKELVRPGISTQDLEEAAIQIIRDCGAQSACYGYQLGRRRYPAHTCISVNEEVVHGIPSLRRILSDGDLVSLDIVLSYKGFIGDNAVTVPCGSLPPDRAKLLEVTEEALRLGIAQARVGNRIGDISNAIQRHVEAAGFSVVRELVGHGVGLSMHEEPQIPNFGRRNSGEKIRAGMTLAIEPMVNMGLHRTKTLADGWTVVTSDNSLSAHFEHTVLTAEAGPEVLTIPQAGAHGVHALPRI